MPCLGIDRWNPRQHSFDNILASLFLMLDEAVDSTDTQLNGLVVLVDFKGFGLSHARQVGPSRIQAIVTIVQVKKMDEVMQLYNLY